jgi:glycosyl-4,4'-diaponeurosporenoate acyltransferase
MQIFYLPSHIMVILFFIFWPIMQVGAGLIGRSLPTKILTMDRWLFKPRKWEENNNIYHKIFFVHKWKKFLPDGDSFIKGGFEKKKLKSFDREYLERFIVESCRAETAHWLQILPFWIFGFFAPFFVVFLMLIYAIIVNIPCIIAQRYNRPRIKALIEKMK